ncbi:hypothetical protein [Chitinophaga sp. sic0106]|uniref:hypothetical protein n=1 Tax=Chitinophaga sp. sic0106 TaxID=2854785 RepID=UPI001C44743A|nr:hypothetical protein [Chitinophaga sp. sic0106]MBV7531189.1 hypothetical protein [Chitinophaga sp. sic0106]
MAGIFFALWLAGIEVIIIEKDFSLYLPMKYISLSLLAIGLFACEVPSAAYLPPLHTHINEIHLKDTCLGTLQMAIPDRYDTSFTWKHHSDCHTCGNEKLRYQRKAQPIDKESGFFYRHVQADSVDNITVAYSSISKYDHLQKQDNATIARAFREWLAMENSHWKEMGIKTPRDTLMNIDHRCIPVVIYAPKEKEGILCNKAEAYVNMRGYPVIITYLLKAKASDTLCKHFTERTLELINSIKLPD